jgi:putative nucleotidyltransferase with HDIG domain
VGGAAPPARPTSGRHGAIQFGALAPIEQSPAATSLTSEAARARAFALAKQGAAWRRLHGSVVVGGEPPVAELDTLVRALLVEMHDDGRLILPLLRPSRLDRYAMAHALNVAMLTMALAEFVGLSGVDIRAYGVAGLLHDVGMDKVPAEIIDRPGPLTDEERAVVRRHAAEGARLLLESGRSLDLAAVVAYEHHIAPDGNGYPALRYPRRCHYASELVRVCDVYDALRSRRPYRDAWPHDRALAYVQEMAGTEFDADAARALVRLMQDGGATLSELVGNEGVGG